MGEKLYPLLERNGLLTDEQKGCRKGSRGTKDQLLVDKAILKNCRRRLTNLSMAWIDYKKAYNMVPHSWILKCLDMVGAAKNMISIISNSMVNWKTVLTSGGMALGRLAIRRGIFQGDSLVATTVYSDHVNLDPSTSKNESWTQTGKGHEAH